MIKLTIKFFARIFHFTLALNKTTSEDNPLWVPSFKVGDKFKAVLATELNGKDTFVLNRSLMSTKFCGLFLEKNPSWNFSFHILLHQKKFLRLASSAENPKHIFFLWKSFLMIRREFFFVSLLKKRRFSINKNFWIENNFFLRKIQRKNFFSLVIENIQRF